MRRRVLAKPLVIPDTTAPSVPANVTASSVTATGFTLSWSAATDAVGVTGYVVQIDGVTYATPTGTSIGVAGRSASTPYAVRVQARDAAGNFSALSPAITVTTPAAPDVTAPTVPTNVAASSLTTSGFTASWTASTDAVGVTGYAVLLGGVQYGTTAGTSLAVTGRAASTAYSVQVQAFDAAGNTSAPSTAITATTASPPDVTPPTVPTGVTISGITATSFTASWTASTDAVGVTGYDVQIDGTSYATVTTPTVTVTGRAASTAYAVRVRATDAAGNFSALTTAVTATTTAAVVAGMNLDLGFDTSETQALTAQGSAFQTAQAHQHSWRSDLTRLGTGHSERFEIHNNSGDIVNGQSYRAMMDVVDTNDGGDTVNGAVGYGPDVYWAMSVYWPTVAGTPSQATVSSGFGQTTTPDYEMFFELHERGVVNGGTPGINNLNTVSNISLMIRNNQFQFRGRCGTFTWNGTGWNSPAWATTNPSTTGSNDQIPVPIVKSGGTNATMLMDAWLDIILHVKFAKDSTGKIELWARQAGQAFTTGPNLTINGPTHKVVVGSDGVTRTSADYEPATGYTGCYAHLGSYIGSTTWEDANQGAHIVLHDETRRYGTLAEAKNNWGGA